MGVNLDLDLTYASSFSFPRSPIDEVTIEDLVLNRRLDRLTRWFRDPTDIDDQRWEYLLLNCRCRRWEAGFEHVLRFREGRNITILTQWIYGKFEMLKWILENFGDTLFYSHPYPDLVGIAMLETYPYIYHFKRDAVVRISHAILRATREKDREVFPFIQKYVRVFPSGKVRLELETIPLDSPFLKPILVDLVKYVHGVRLDAEIIELVGMCLLDEEKLCVKDMIECQNILWETYASVEHRQALQRVLDAVWEKMPFWCWAWIWCNRRYRVD